MKDRDLIMELTMEQGPARITQVQPPLGAWAQYFDVDFEELPSLQLVNLGVADAEPEIRPVVEHDHNWTIEIAAADVIRPAIIRFRRTGPNQYSYWIYQFGDDGFTHCRWLLDNFENPIRKKGRSWLIV
jgi:hypothetical protein